MHPTDQTLPTTRSRPGIPARICQQCGEFLPHACAPIITITRHARTGRRIITIIGRPAGNGGETA
jgi:hypothetical protein